VIAVIGLILGIGALVIAALLIALWAWMRGIQRADFDAMRIHAARSKDATDEWERPRIVKVAGGIYDGAEDFDG
jgi:hypothetical protein